MKENKGLCINAKRLLILVLAVAIAFTPSLLPSDRAGFGGNTAYADTLEAQIELRVIEEDKLNDTLTLAAYLVKTPDSGLSAIDFKVDYPEAFQLVKIEDKKLMGEGDNSISFGSETLTDRPYYLAFGSMDQATDGLTHETGELASFTFQVKADSRPIAVQDYLFTLKEIKLVALLEEDGYVRTEYIDTNTEAAYTYTSIAGSGITEGAGTIKVSAADTEIPEVKTETIEQAIREGSDAENISLDLTSADPSADTVKKASVALTKEGAAAIAESKKALQIKTDAGQLTFDNTAAASLGNQSGKGKLVVEVERTDDLITVEGISNKAVKFDVSAKLVDSENRETPITQFGGGEVEVALDLPAELQGKTVNCWNYTDTNYTPVSGETTAEQFVFQTNHFSKYIVAEPKTLEVFKEQNQLSEGVSVSGTVTAWNDVNDTVMRLYPASLQTDAIKKDIKSAEPTLGQEISLESAITTNAKRFDQKYSITGITNGEYVIAVYKPKHAVYITNKLEIVDDTVQNVELYLLGDVNKDGLINILDVQACLDLCFGSADTGETVAEADIDENGSINILDVQAILELCF